MINFRVVGKAILVALLCLLTVAIGAPLFKTSLIELLQNHKGWVLSAFVVFPMVYVITQHVLSKTSKGD